MKRYSFTIVFKPYKRESPLLDNIRTIYNNNTCIVAKNSKHGGLYLHPNAEIIHGSFFKTAGSVRYPVLAPKKEVHIRVKGIKAPPNISSDQFIEQDVIFVKDILVENE